MNKVTHTCWLSIFQSRKRTIAQMLGKDEQSCEEWYAVACEAEVAPTITNCIGREEDDRSMRQSPLAQRQ
jgi:hypothetical protein